MKRLLAGRGTTVAVMGMLLALVAGGSYALAASGGKTITVCIKKNGGGLYKARKCKKHDSKLSWNQQGPAGKAGKNGATGFNGAPGTVGAPGPDGFQQIGTFGGNIGTIDPSGDNFVFAGPTTQVTTNATQGLTASGSAALGASNAVQVAVGICKQLASGGPITILSTDSDLFQDVGITTTTLSYGMSQTVAPGAGTWNIGMCVDDGDTTQALDKNDFSEGYAFVTNSSAPNPPATTTMAKSKTAHAH
jgi:hypothetical protein